MTDKTTAKVAPRKGESDTGKLPTSIGGLLKKAKENPWVLLVVALGGGTGSQEVLAQLGQHVQWWWVALGIGGFAAVDAATRLLRDVSEIKASLRVGAEKFEHLESDVKSLHDWRKEVVAQQVAAATSGRKSKPKGSEGNLRTA